MAIENRHKKDVQERAARDAEPRHVGGGTMNGFGR